MTHDLTHDLSSVSALPPHDLYNPSSNLYNPSHDLYQSNDRHQELVTDASLYPQVYDLPPLSPDLSELSDISSVSASLDVDVDITFEPDDTSRLSPLPVELL